MTASIAGVLAGTVILAAIAVLLAWKWVEGIEKMEEDS